MFGKDKDKTDTGGLSPEGEKSDTRAAGADKVATPDASSAPAMDGDMSAPPLKPFSKKGTHALAKTTGASFRPEIPRRLVDIPGASKRSDHMLELEDEANRLTVGRNICLSGEITACEKLVVEGRVEAMLTDAHTLKVAPSGYFKGNADVIEADINGYFEGSLVAKEILTIRNEGRINGSVRYGRIIIESGGEISGDMASLDQSNETPDGGE